MNRLRQRIVAVMLSFLLCFSLLSGCAKTPDENETALQNQWMACLEASEQIYSNMLWAFEYAEAFSQDNSWESLQKARAACCSVIQSMYAMQLPENTMSQEQLFALMEKGIEADVVTVEIAQLPTLLNYKLNTMKCLLYLLRDDVYLAPSANKIGNWVKSNHNNALQQCEYLAVTTNYLLLQMQDTGLWNDLSERCPSIGKFCSEWKADPDDLQMEADRILDEMALQLDAESEYLGISEYTLKTVQDAVASGDLQPLSDALHTMDHVPAWFPMPDWLPQEILWYYLTEDESTGDLNVVQTGEDLSEELSACYIPCDGITMEDVHRYEERLVTWGMNFYSTEENGTYQILVDGGDSDLLLTWTQEKTTLYLTGKIGCLMPELYLAAMTME